MQRTRVRWAVCRVGEGPTCRQQELLLPRWTDRKTHFRPAWSPSGWCLCSWCRSDRLHSGAITRTLTARSQTLVSLLSSQGTGQPHPFPSSQRRRVSSGCKQCTALARGSRGVPMPPASRDRNTLCSFVTRVPGITGCSERDYTTTMLQKVPSVNCPCCNLSSIKNRCVSAINC